jgi:hypothetical protein
MKTITLSVLALFAFTALPAEAKTVVLGGLHPAKKVESMCKSYGGTYSQSRTGHGCAKAGYGKVWCSKAGKCVARYNDNIKLAQK